MFGRRAASEKPLRNSVGSFGGCDGAKDDASVPWGQTGGFNIRASVGRRFELFDDTVDLLGLDGRCGGEQSSEGRQALAPVSEGCQHRQDGPVAVAVLPQPSICELTDCVNRRSSSAGSGPMLIGGAANGNQAELRDARDWVWRRRLSGRRVAKAVQREVEVCVAAVGGREWGYSRWKLLPIPR